MLKRVLPSFVTDGGDAAASNTVVAPMTGTVVKVMVKPGDAVKKGDAVAIMEAMKMEVGSLGDGQTHGRWRLPRLMVCALPFLPLSWCCVRLRTASWRRSMLP